MAIEIWYRGEAVNLPPAKSGGMTHDLGDGLYFADTLAGARPFAQRAPNPADQRLYQLRMDFDAMKVLNLSRDPKWNAYMSEPLAGPGTGGQSRMAFLEQMPSAEHYHAFFTAYLKKNNIDLNHYDAVIGPLLQHGGNQICVLHKNGQPSPWAVRMRGLLVPLGPAVATATPRGLLRFGGKLGPGIRVGGGILGAIVVSLFSRWLLGKFLERVIRSEIDRQLVDLEPEVMARVRRMKSQVLFILAETRRPFAELRFAVESVTTIEVGPPGSFGGSIDGSTGFPTVSLKDVRIADRELPEGGVEDGTEMAPAGSYARTSTTYFRATVPITATDEEVNLFRAYLAELNWYSEQLSQSPSAEDTRRLTRERNALQAKFDAALAG